MTFYSNLLIVVIGFFFTSCSSVKIYKNSNSSALTQEKLCGVSFCTLLTLHNNIGRIMITDVKGLEVDANHVKIKAFCFFPKQQARRRNSGLHLTAYKNLNLNQQSGFWQFLKENDTQGCLLTVQVS